MDLRVQLWIGHVRHVEDDVAVACLLQSALKGLDQVVRQLSDKAYRICQKNILAAGKLKHPGGGIQSGEQLVLRQNPCVGQIIEQRGLACVGVAHNGRRHGAVSVSLLSGHLPVAFYVLQFCLQLPDSLMDQTPVRLQLLLSWSSRSDSSSQT